MVNKKLELINNVIDRLDGLFNDDDNPTYDTYISDVEDTIQDTIRYSKELKQILLEEDTYKNASENVEV